MAWSDIFLPAGAQTADEQQANYEKQLAVYNSKFQARVDAGDAPPPTAYLDESQLLDQNAAAAQGLQEGAAQGLQNVLDFPGKVVGAVGDGASSLLGGVLKNVPWWVYAGALVALFVWMGGLSLLRGRLAR